MEADMAQLESHRSQRNGHARDALRSRADDVISDFAELRRDVSRLADAATKAARSEMEHASDRLQTARSQLMNSAKGGATYVGNQVRQRPAAVIGVTLGAGLLIGMLLSARRH
jgi:ElaB/YqjD/DUF883 family membrane-anchored ribosome-binding protein